jgi:hypothetical protein
MPLCKHCQKAHDRIIDLCFELDRAAYAVSNPKIKRSLTDHSDRLFGRALDISRRTCVLSPLHIKQVISDLFFFSGFFGHHSVAMPILRLTSH